MEVLFSHPNFPGQFRRVARAFAQIPGLKVYGVGDEDWMKSHNGPLLEGVQVIPYPAPPKSPAGSDELHPYVKTYNDAVRRAEQVLNTLTAHKVQGLEPDVIFTHPGWGDAFYLRDIFPGAKVIGLFEYYYQPRGADAGFDPEFPSRLDDLFRIRSMNATQLMALDACDAGFCPTQW
ncbi:MAG: glycosyl transferase family 1, partial [Pseudomonadota bacterium]